MTLIHDIKSGEAPASRIRDGVGGIKDGEALASRTPTQEASLDDEAYASCVNLSG